MVHLEVVLSRQASCLLIKEDLFASDSEAVDTHALELSMVLRLKPPLWAIRVLAFLLLPLRICLTCHPHCGLWQSCQYHRPLVPSKYSTLPVPKLTSALCCSSMDLQLTYLCPPGLLHHLSQKTLSVDTSCGRSLTYSGQKIMVLQSQVTHMIPYMSFKPYCYNFCHLYWQFIWFLNFATYVSVADFGMSKK